MKIKDIVIIILIALLIVLSFTFFIKEALHLKELKKLNQSMLNKERAYEITLTQLIISTNNLWQHFQTFSVDYRQLLTEQEAADEIKVYIVLIGASMK